MPQFGDAKGEFRGTTVRNDAALKTWLAKHTEAALEPDLPIIDPHHHFWDTPQRGRYLLPELLADIGGGHNIVSTVFLECRAMYRKSGPPRDGGTGRGRVRQRHRSDECVGWLRTMPRGRGHSRRRRPQRRCAGARTARSRDRRRRRAPARAAPRCGVGWQRSRRQIRLPCRSSASGARPEIPRRLRATGAARPELRILAVSSATTGCDRPGARASRAPPSSSTMLAAYSASDLIPAIVRRSWQAGARTSTNWPNVRTSIASSAASAWCHSASTSTSATCRHRRKTLPPHGAMYVEPCIEAFGVNRCMFESNFPPDKQSCGYTELWNAFKRITANASASEKTALYSGTAAKVYRLTVP